MFPFDSWLAITAQIPLWLLPLLLLALIASTVGAVLAGRQARNRFKTLSAEAEVMRHRLAASTEQRARETYRHFIRNISHEVSNPLQSIQTNLDNMANCPPDEAQRWRQYHAIIVAEVRRLARITENLRILSHLESPEFPVVREPVNVMAVVEDVIMAMYETAEARGVHLQCTGPRRPARVLGNRDGLRQMLTNLVDNGIKYAKDEGGRLVISMREEQDRLCVRVADEGIGIPAEDLPHIFDLAYRALDARNLQRKGSGLGLAIVKRIVEEHGGTITVESVFGQGTTFSFDLPLYLPPQ